MYKNGSKKEARNIYRRRFLIQQELLRLEWLEWELMQKKPEGNRMGYGSAKEMDDDFTSRSAVTKKKKPKSNEPEAGN
jgi:hypothetical protein